MSDRLAAAAEVLGQKGLGDGIKREPVVRPHETVSLIGKGDVGNGHAAVLEGRHHLLRFGGDDPDIPHALRDQDRTTRAVDMGKRRTLDKKGAARFGIGIAEPIFPDAEPRTQ